MEPLASEIIGDLKKKIKKQELIIAALFLAVIALIIKNFI